MQREHHHRARTIAIAVVLAFIALLILARPARAGSYVVTQCSSVSAVAEAKWERSSEHYRARQRCGTDAGLQVYHDAQATAFGHFGIWTWRAPLGTMFTHVQVNASLTNQAGHRAELVATRAGGERVEFGAEHGDFRVHSLSGEFSQLHAGLRCVAGSPCGRAGSDSAHAYVRGIYLRTDDRASPAVALTGGSMLAAPVVRGTRTLGFDGADPGGGIRRVWVEAGGHELATDVRNCAVTAGFATALRPCPAATSEVVEVATASSPFATGPNAVRACVEDLALDGAPNRACETASVWVDNTCPSSPVGGATAVEAKFGAGEIARTRSDRVAVVRGRLVGAHEGATVCALTRDELAGAPIVVAGVAATTGGGGFEIPLAPGPNREVFVHHALGDSVVARHGLRVRAAVRPALGVRPRTAVRNRDRLRFSGALPAPSCAGRMVKVQAQVGKRRWQAFRAARSGASCEFRARYRLRATRSARRYRFRAFVPEQPGYPYEPGRSAVVKVKVARD